jgi:hypothetical protein
MHRSRLRAATTSALKEGRFERDGREEVIGTTKPEHKGGPCRGPGVNMDDVEDKAAANAKRSQR